jgi:hypothetical protein
MANSTSTATIDPVKSKRYPIYLSDSILKKDEEGQSLYTGIRCRLAKLQLLKYR